MHCAAINRGGVSQGRRGTQRRADRTTIASVLIFMLFSFKQCRYYEPKLAVVVPSRHSMYQPNGSTAGSAQFSPN
jgi:hypothetical protein